MNRQYDDLMSLEDALKHIVLCADVHDVELDQPDGQILCPLQPNSDPRKHDAVLRDVPD